MKRLYGPTLLLASNSAWNLAHFRRPLIEAFLARGARLVAAVPDGDNVALLESLGVEVQIIPLDRKGMSPRRDLVLLAAYRSLLAGLRPAAMLAFTAKPNIYGSLAAASLRIPVINNISGLGTGFLGSGWLEWLMRAFYRRALSRSRVVFFQNPDDRSLFLDGGLVRPRQSGLLPGSGIDLDAFRAAPMPEGAVRFLLVARMLRDKGVGEFVEAARMLQGRGAHFLLLGPAGDDNRSAIDEGQLRRWEGEGLVEWLGATDDVRPHIAASHVVVLPSYREGMPRTLIEAAAIGRPVIASDVPGCRQAVNEGVTGLLCAARSAESLADAMERMLAMDPAARVAMGTANRARAEAEFGADAIVSSYLDALAACGVALPA